MRSEDTGRPAGMPVPMGPDTEGRDGAAEGRSRGWIPEAEQGVVGRVGNGVLARRLCSWRCYYANWETFYVLRFLAKRHFGRRNGAGIEGWCRQYFKVFPLPPGCECLKTGGLRAWIWLGSGNRSCCLVGEC